jgi:hypothetical protein
VDRPSFARDFPDDPELAALVEAFSAGDYRRVRDLAPKLAAKTEDEKVRAAANELRRRIEPDPLAKMLLVATLALLVVLSAWWIAHDGPPLGAPNKPAPTIERVPDPFRTPRP